MSKITDYLAAERYFGRRFLLLMVGGVFLLIPVSLAFSKGLLSPRALASVMITYAACVTFAVFVILRNARARLQVSAGECAALPDDKTRRKLRGKIRRLQFAVAFFALVFVYALWATRDGPLVPRLVGASVNLLIQVALIQAIRRLQKLLQ